MLVTSMLRDRRVVVFAALSLLAACGARTDLNAEGSSRGGQGANGQGANGQGANGQGANGQGAGSSCPADEVDPIEVTTPECNHVTATGYVDGGQGFHQRGPVLTYSSDDRTQVTVLSGWTIAASPTSPAALRHTSWMPWQLWPVDGWLGPSHVADFTGGSSYAAAPMPGDKLTISFALPGGDIWTSRSFVPGSPEIPPSFRVSYGGEHALTTVPGPERTLVVTEGVKAFGAPEGWHQFEFFTVTEAPADVGGTILGCGNATLGADAIRSPEGLGYLLAYSLGGSQEDVSCATQGHLPEAPAPNRIQIMWMNELGYEDINSSDERERIPIEGLAGRVRLAPSPVGAWLVAGSQAGGNRLYVEHLDPFGYSMLELQEIATPRSLDHFDAKAFGDTLAVAWVEDDPEGGPGQVIQIRMLDIDNQPIASAQIRSGRPVVGAPSLLGADDGQRLLVAWSETPECGEDRIRVIRLDCAL
ncbi:Hypothetical protein CAP_2900 [Chondromyces apiculatus DSM 436]|uniref:Secreted protein n=2 Tax=Chondromyces apiculatus TaxID=51 RepID=A0A017T9E5_9BACT|nr:Hypothetical protein CAP_2900 [Chondromyces apiculatus DSM 436]